MSSTTGDKIKSLRTALGESQAVFGERFGVEQATISRWEKGEPVQRKYMAAVADLAGMTVAEFFHSREAPRLVPVVGHVRSGGMLKFLNPAPGADVEHIRLEHGGADQVAVRIMDDSMSPVYRAGDVVIGQKAYRQENSRSGRKRLNCSHYERRWLCKVCQAGPQRAVHASGL